MSNRRRLGSVPRPRQPYAPPADLREFLGSLGIVPDQVADLEDRAAAAAARGEEFTVRVVDVEWVQ